MASTWNATMVAYPNNVTITDVANTIRTPFQAGYTQTRPKNARAIKRFELKWTAMTDSDYNTLVRFFWDNKGGAQAFNYEFPYVVTTAGVAALPSSVGTGNGWYSVATFTSASGPVVSVRFANDEIQATRIVDVGRHEVVISLETV